MPIAADTVVVLFIIAAIVGWIIWLRVGSKAHSRVSEAVPASQELNEPGPQERKRQR